MSRKPIYFALALCALITVLSFLTHTPVNAAPPVGCRTTPAKPTLTFPAESSSVATYRVTLTWNQTRCAASYTVIVKSSSAKGRVADGMTGLTQTHYQTRPLAPGHRYTWQVKACNMHGCTKSKKFSFINTQEQAPHQ